MPQTSVPNDALMKTQQAKDSAAPKRAKTRTKATSNPKTRSASKQDSTKAKPAAKTVSKTTVAARTGKPKAKTVKATPAPAATGQGTVKPEPAASKPETATAAPAKPKEDARSGWSLGRLFSFFSRSKGEKALEKASDSSLGKGR